MVNLYPDSRMRYDDVRAHVCYDFRKHSDLLVGHDGEWYLGGREGFLSSEGWCNLKHVSDILHTLNQERVRCMRRHGQVDNHIKAKEARDGFEWSVNEIANEAKWELRSRNFGHAKRLRNLADRCRPLIDHVWSRDWIEAQEMMSDCLSRMEP